MGTICADARPQYDVRCAAKSYRTWYEVRIIGHPQARGSSKVALPCQRWPFAPRSEIDLGLGLLEP